MDKQVDEIVNEDTVGRAKTVGWTRQRLLILAILALLDLCLYTCYSLLPPFYPPLAAEKGVPQFWVGLISALCRIVMFLSCPFWGIRVAHCGPIRILQYGLLTISASVIGFAILPLLDAHWLFISFSLVLRSIEGFGNGMVMTGLFTVVTQEFSDRVGQVTGWLEGGSSTAGNIIGPIFGGLLHQEVGFWLPFVVFGSVMMVSGFVCRLSLRHYRDVYPTPDAAPGKVGLTQTETLAGSSLGVVEVEADVLDSKQVDRAICAAPEISIMEMLKTPVVLVVGLCLVAVCSAMGLLEVGLAIHINELNLKTNNTLLSDSGKNALFFLAPLSYGVLMFAVLGKCIDIFKTYRTFFTISLVLSTIGCVFIGPAPILVRYIPELNDPQSSLVSIVISLVTIGTSFAFCHSPLVPALLVIAINKGYPQCTATSGVASGCVGVFSCLGMVIGPSISALLCDKFGFAFAASVFAYIMAFTSVFFCVFSFLYGHWFVDKNTRLHSPAQSL